MRLGMARGGSAEGLELVLEDLVQRLLVENGWPRDEDVSVTHRRAARKLVAEGRESIATGRTLGGLRIPTVDADERRRIADRGLLAAYLHLQGLGSSDAAETLDAAEELRTTPEVALAGRDGTRLQAFTKADELVALLVYLSHDGEDRPLPGAEAERVTLAPGGRLNLSITDARDAARLSATALGRDGRGVRGHPPPLADLGPPRPDLTVAPGTCTRFFRVGERVQVPWCGDVAAVDTHAIPRLQSASLRERDRPQDDMDASTSKSHDPSHVIWTAVVESALPPAPQARPPWEAECLGDAWAEHGTVNQLTAALLGSRTAVQALQSLLSSPARSLMPPALVTVAGDFLVHGALRLRLDAFLRHCLTPVAGCPEPSAPQAPHAVLRALAAAAAEILAAHASELQGLAERAAAARASFEGGDFPTGSCDGAPTVAPPVTLLEAMHLTRGVRDDIGLLARLCLGMEGADEEAVLSAVLQAGREVHGRGQAHVRVLWRACTAPVRATIGSWLLTPLPLSESDVTPRDGQESSASARPAGDWVPRAMAACTPPPLIPASLASGRAAEECLEAGAQLRLLAEMPGAGPLVSRLCAVMEEAWGRAWRTSCVVQGDELCDPQPGCLPDAATVAGVAAVRGAWEQAEVRGLRALARHLEVLEEEARQAGAAVAQEVQRRHEVREASARRREEERGSVDRAERRRKADLLAEQRRTIEARARASALGQAQDREEDLARLVASARKARDAEVDATRAALEEAVRSISGRTMSPELSAWRLERLRLSAKRDAKLRAEEAALGPELRAADRGGNSAAGLADEGRGWEGMGSADVVGLVAEQEQGGDVRREGDEEDVMPRRVLDFESAATEGGVRGEGRSAGGVADGKGDSRDEAGLGGEAGEAGVQGTDVVARGGDGAREEGSEGQGRRTAALVRDGAPASRPSEREERGSSVDEKGGREVALRDGQGPGGPSSGVTSQGRSTEGHVDRRALARGSVGVVSAEAGPSDAPALPWEVAAACVELPARVQHRLTSAACLALMRAQLGLPGHLASVRAHFFILCGDVGDTLVTDLRHLCRERGQLLSQPLRDAWEGALRGSSAEALPADHVRCMGVELWHKGRRASAVVCSGSHLAALEAIRPTYALPWPLAAVFPHDWPQSYAAVYTCVLQLRWAGQALSEMWVDLAEAGRLLQRRQRALDRARRLLLDDDGPARATHPDSCSSMSASAVTLASSRLRTLLAFHHIAAHLASSLHLFVVTHATGAALTRFDAAVAAAEDVAGLARAHRAYLEEVLRDTMLGKDPGDSHGPGSPTAEASGPAGAARTPNPMSLRAIVAEVVQPAVDVASAASRGLWRAGPAAWLADAGAWGAVEAALHAFGKAHVTLQRRTAAAVSRQERALRMALTG